MIETALGAELTEHLGYPPRQAPPDGAGNHRNGSTPKTVQSELGPVTVNTPRDRAGTFEPQLVGKRQTRLAGLDEKILGLYAGRMSVRDIEGHLRDLYGVNVGRDTISRVSDAILEDVQAWRTRPLGRVYPIAYFDCLMVKVRKDRSVQNRACYLAIGVSVEGEREVLGIWWQDTDGAKFWLAVLNDLHQRGVQDVLVCCVDGLNGPCDPPPWSATSVCGSAGIKPSNPRRCAGRRPSSPRTRTHPAAPSCLAVDGQASHSREDTAGVS